eukprot:260188-Hanusia_phi.AAC.3
MAAESQSSDLQRRRSHMQAANLASPPSVPASCCLPRAFASAELSIVEVDVGGGDGTGDVEGDGSWGTWEGARAAKQPGWLPAAAHAPTLSRRQPREQTNPLRSSPDDVKVT